MTANPPAKRTLRLVVYGRVQGVYFRHSMRREAQGLAIAGWVRNRSDGAVEAVVHGESTAVDLMVRWANLGPEMARVEQVEVFPQDGEFASFEIM